MVDCVAGDSHGVGGGVGGLPMCAVYGGGLSSATSVILEAKTSSTPYTARMGRP